MANRFDIFSAKVTPRKDSNGFLLVDSTPTRSGVFIYKDSLGNQWGELRHPDDVFSKETLDSLNLIPYTVQENHVALFTTKDARNKTYGFTSNDAERVDNFARVGIKITDEAEINAVERKDSLELSAGYKCDVINESGVFDGLEYNKRQRNIRYNHVARVSNARGGETCRIRLDSESAIYGIEADRIDSEDVSKTKHGESIMTMVKRKIPAVEVKDFRLDSDPVEIPAEYEGVVDRFEKRQEAFETALKERESKLDSMDEELTKKQARIDALEKENEEVKKINEGLIPLDKANELAEERSYLFKVADDFKLDMKEVKTMSNHEIKKAVCVKAEKVKDVSKLDNETYCEAVFDGIDLAYEKKKAQSKENFDSQTKQNGKSIVELNKTKGAA